MRSLQLLVRITVIAMLPASGAASAPRPGDELGAPSLSLREPLKSAEYAPLKRGWLAYQRGDLAEALMAYQEALASSPTDASLWYDTGCLHALTHDVTKARAVLQHALILNPYLAVAHDAVGQLNELSGDLDGARIAYVNAAQIEPTNAKFLRHLIQALLRLDESDAAREALAQLLLVKHDDVEARYQLGVLELRRNAPDVAINEFHAVLERDPTHVPAWNGLALAFARIGQLEQADEALKKAKALDPTSAITDTNLGVIAARQERWGDAREAWSRALEHQPRYAPASKNLELIESLTPPPNP